jgi:hypothetical protein
MVAGRESRDGMPHTRGTFIQKNIAGDADAELRRFETAHYPRYLTRGNALAGASYNTCRNGVQSTGSLVDVDL